MWSFRLLSATLLFISTSYTSAKIDLPNFDKLKSVYPGFSHHGGKVDDKTIMALIGGRKDLTITETTGLRLSYALNQIKNGHEINSYPRELTNLTTYWSTMGTDGNIYLPRALAFGPYLAVKYGNPEMVRPSIWNREQVMDSFVGRQGLMRIVTYNKRKKASAFVGLWDCNKFYKTRDYSQVLHLLSVEFWEIKNGLGCSYNPKENRKHIRGKNYRKKFR